jgi:hypothetical protein
MMSFPFGDLGPATVIWDVDGTPLDLGDTLGSTQFTDEPSYKEIRAETYGENPVDAVFVGRKASLVVPLTRTALAKLEKVIPSLTVAGQVATAKASVGTQMYANAKKVTVKKVTDGAVSTTPTEWLTIFKAYPVTKSDWKFDSSNQRVCEVTFLCFPCQESGVVGNIWKIGE